eukprot:868-Heterococcus_DN1.PRE.3
MHVIKRDGSGKLCAPLCAFALSDPTASCVRSCSCCALYAAVLNCRASRSKHASVVPSRCSVLRSPCRRENVQFDKITARIKKLCYGLDDRYVDPIILSQKVIQGEQSLTALSTCCTSHLGTRTSAPSNHLHPCADAALSYRRLPVSFLSTVHHAQTVRLLTYWTYWLCCACTAAAAAAAAGVYPGVTTSELDELAAQTAAYMATQHPGWSQLAARISVSNLHKNTCKVFSENIEQLHKYVHPKTGAPASLISDEVYEIVQKHKDTLNSAIINDRDCECS